MYTYISKYHIYIKKIEPNIIYVCIILKSCMYHIKSMSNSCPNHVYMFRSDLNLTAIAARHFCAY